MPPQRSEARTPPLALLDRLGLRTVTAKIVAPIVIVLIVGPLLMIASITSESRDNVTTSTQISAQTTIDVFRLLRGYYTENVVAEVREHADDRIEVSFEHQRDHGPPTIPLPATMIRDLGDEMANKVKDGTKFRLYSRYPFPHNADRVLDRFARDALDAIERNPDEPFVRTEQVDGHDVLRLAIADRMQNMSCVNCHNTHPDTPRTGWELDDVRGVLEVTAPIEDQLVANEHMMTSIAWSTVLGILVIVLSVALVIYTVILRPIRRINAHLSRMAGDGRFDRRIAVNTSDEIGGLADHINHLAGSLERALDEKDALNKNLEARVAERSSLAVRQAAQLRSLALALTVTEQRERKRLADVLHDHLQQLLAAAKLSLSPLKRRFAEESREREALLDTQSMLEESIKTARELSVELSPPELREGGLSAGLRWLAAFMKKAHALEVTLSLDDEAEPVDAHVRTILFQAARELLFNVVKHAGTLAATVTSRVDDGALTIVVEDAGVGVEVSAMKVAHYGLESLRNRLELVNGSVAIDSAPGEGFRATLRVVTRLQNLASPPSGVPAAPPSPVTSSRDPSGPIRVLVVDDMPIYRRGLASLLSGQLDIEVVGVASSGDEAVALAAASSPDIVLMDYAMPRMTGAEATRLIRQSDPSIRVFGLSMHDAEFLADEMGRAGAERVLAKDVSFEELIAALRDAGGHA